MSSLEAKESLPPQKHKEIKKTKSHAQDTQNKTKHSKTLNLHTYTQANTLHQRYNLAQSQQDQTYTHNQHHN